MWNDLFSVIFKHRVALSLCILSRISITEKGQRGKEEVKTQCPSEDVELKVFESFNFNDLFNGFKKCFDEYGATYLPRLYIFNFFVWVPGDPPELL